MVTSGDRSDIVILSLAANRVPTYPHVSGLILTGNFTPAPQIQRLIDGLRSFSGTRHGHRH